MTLRTLLLGLVAVAIPLAVAAVDLASIRTPRPAGWVTDTAGLLDEAAVQRINAIGDEVHARDGAELAVVTIGSTGGADARAFATELLNHWRIGDAERDNGVQLEKLRYGAWFTSYAKCPPGKAATKSSAETTLEAAIHDRGGRVRIDEHCEFCGYRKSFERSTPKKTWSSSSSSSGFGGGSSSGRKPSGRW